MFSENKKGQDQGSQPNRIEANTHIKGDISSQADFRIDGVLEGNLSTTGKVVIGASGKITGNVSCVQADIAGGFEGELEVDGLVYFPNFIITFISFSELKPTFLFVSLSTAL